jgi:hypothetical protein
VALCGIKSDIEGMADAVEISAGKACELELDCRAEGVLAVRVATGTDGAAECGSLSLMTARPLAPHAIMLIAWVHGD